MPQPSILRRTPRQRRGEARVQQILDATELLFDELGADAITTNHIARRAGVDIRSVYYFFEDKFQIFQAIVERAGAELTRQLRDFETLDPKNLDEWIEAFVDSNASLWQREFRAIRMVQALRTRPEMLSMIEIQDGYNIDILSEGLKRFCPALSRVRRRRVARVANLAMCELLMDATALPSVREQNAIVREIQVLLRSYLRELSNSPGAAVRRLAKETR